MTRPRLSDFTALLIVGDQAFTRQEYEAAQRIRECKRAYDRRRAQTPERQAYMREWRARNVERRRAYGREWMRRKRAVA